MEGGGGGGAEASLHQDGTNSAPQQASSPQPSYVACKRCGHRLAEASHLAPHEPGPGQLAFAWSKRQAGGEVVCTSLFVEEALPWMGDLAEVEGKLLCPHCSYRVGSYHWSGAQCSCGHWSTPAIQLHKSRIDERLIQA